MSSNDQLQFIIRQKFLNHVRTECIRNTSEFIVSPARMVLWKKCHYRTGSLAQHENRYRIIWFTLDGSDHNKSFTIPVKLLIGYGLIMLSICSAHFNSGLRPPWQQNILLPITAASGRQSKNVANRFHKVTLNRCLPEKWAKKINFRRIIVPAPTVFQLTFVKKSVFLVNYRAFVISPQKVNVFRVFYL